MDIFIENLIKKDYTSKDRFIQIIIAILGSSLAILSFLFVKYLGFAIACGIVYLSYLLFISFDIEYEYILTNDELDIDKITAKRKRKRLVTVNYKLFKNFSKYNYNEINNKNCDKIICACSNIKNDDTYYAEVNHKKLGYIIIVFSPNQKIIEQINKYTNKNRNSLNV